MKMTLVSELKGHQDRVWCVAWNPSGTVLASCSGDKAIRLWGTEGDGAWTCKAVLLDGHRRTVRSVAWSPCGQRLASASFDGTVCVWRRDSDSSEWESVATLEGHESEVKAVAWSPSGRHLATCGRDKTVWIWDVDDGDEFECASVQTCHSQDVKTVVWHPTQEVLVSAGYDNTVRVYTEELEDWECGCTLSGHQSTVWAVDFEGGGGRMASASADGSVRIWNTEDKSVAEWTCQGTVPGLHARPVYSVSWCPQTGLLATGCGDNGVRVFAEEGGCWQPGCRVSHEQDVNCVAWNPVTPGLLASAGDDCLIRMWQVEPAVVQ